MCAKGLIQVRATSFKLVYIICGATLITRASTGQCHVFYDVVLKGPVYRIEVTIRPAAGRILTKPGMMTFLVYFMRRLIRVICLLTRVSLGSG